MLAFGKSLAAVPARNPCQTISFINIMLRRGEFGDGLDDLRVETLLTTECGVRYVNTDLPRNFSKNV